MKPGRKKGSPWKYDRAAIRYVLEHEGLEAARARWNRGAVDPIARVLGLTKPYNQPAPALTPEQVALLGTKPDSVLAGEWGMAFATVGSQRKLLGIPPCERAWRRLAFRERLREIPDADLTGRLYDLSLRVRISPPILASERRRRGLKVRHQGVSGVSPIVERRAVAFRALRATYPGITLEELAEVFRITRERVRQIEQQMAIEHGLSVAV